MSCFRTAGLLAVLIGSACQPGAVLRYIDADDDGHPLDEDCDDADAAVGGPLPWFKDSDGDTYGVNADSIVSCAPPDGYVEDYGDCDDTDAAVNPDASEICNGLDDDCNGMVDELKSEVWYLDYDGDTYGDPNSAYPDGCEASSYFVGNGEDCDDLDPDVHPGATEVCDGSDNDCDGASDEDDAADVLTWYEDADGDGHGSNVTEEACEEPEGYVDSTGDCVDTDPRVYNGATEVCDELDNDCDGQTNEGLTWTWVYEDEDGDGFGDNSHTSSTCDDSLPTEYGTWVWNNTDCDDEDPDIHPGASEVCDGVDNDCDGSIDPDSSTDASTWYSDMDSDGFGDVSSSTTACSVPSGAVADATDCDDTDGSINPAADEVCDGADNDCDGAVDPSNAEGTEIWYLDSDSDSFGDASVSFVSCDAPAGYVADATDCDDADASAFPGGSEVCDGADNDCDGSIDPDSSTDASTWYVDRDSDSYGDPSSNAVFSCSQPTGYVSNAYDCDDSDSSMNPEASEVCNEADDDCDGEVDEGVEYTFFADGDGDTFGNPGSTEDACSAPSGYVVNDNDCDDDNPASFPGNSEVCDDIDNDCDGSVDEGVTSTFYADNDNDTFGTSASSSASCSAPAGYVDNASDCDDTDPSVNPVASEVCDGIDNDCDGTVDEDVESTFYPDLDGDGFGDPNLSESACEAPEGYVADATDCDDDDASSYPDAPESCDDLDNDCDGSIDENLFSTWYVDADGDLYGAGEAVDVICMGNHATLVDNAEDCNDSNASVNPDATEVCDGVDNDCDAFSVEECPVP